MYYFPEEKLEAILEPDILKQYQDQYQNEKPFPHMVFNDTFDEWFLSAVVDSFPNPNHTHWWKYDNVFEKKLAKDNISEFPEAIRNLIRELSENRFVSFLEKLTGIKGLIVDHTLNGAGLHQIQTGGKLDIHADYNFHPITGLDRRVNVLIYLNENWNPSWGGNLEFWDQDMKQCVKSIEPLYNRMVIFNSTDTSYHGHPEPLSCPADVTRKSIALYYYTNGRPYGELSRPHSTLYQRRPNDPLDQSIEELRVKRSERRIP